MRRASARSEKSCTHNVSMSSSDRSSSASRKEVISVLEGLLLACVRDQINLTVSSYRKLYESSIAFGIRKSVNADKLKLEMRLKIESKLQS